MNSSVFLYRTNIKESHCHTKFRTANLIKKIEPSYSPILLVTNSTIVQIESSGVAKVLQSEKYAVEILDTMDI
jgi:hypothetical protein